MKWLIASDIHGSAYWCRKLVEAYKSEKAERMILLGDVLYHGPRNELPRDYNPKEVIALLNDMKDEVVSVRGNCDTEVDQMVLGFPVLADYMLIPVGKTTIFATHGHVYNCDRLPPLKSGDILLHGHTHVPACTGWPCFTYINPGSVSIPKENSHHGYIVLDGQTFTFKDFDGNVKETFNFQLKNYPKV